MTTNPLIYKNSEGKAKCMAIYDAALAHWPVPYEQLDVPTRFGSTHVIASEPQDAPPLTFVTDTAGSGWSIMCHSLSQLVTPPNLWRFVPPAPGRSASPSLLCRVDSPMPAQHAPHHAAEVGTHVLAPRV
jgi:hypothetical protein